MTRTDAATASEADSAELRLAARMELFFSGIAAAGDGQVIEQARGSDPQSGRSATNLHVSVVDMFLRQTIDEWRTTDHIAVLSISLEAATQTDGPKTITLFAGPEAIRNASSTDPNGIVMNDLAVAEAPWSWTHHHELSISLALLRVTRNKRSQRVLETIETMIPVIDYASPASASWAEAIMDRVEVLAHSADGQWVLAATLRCAAAPWATRYGAFVAPSERSRSNIKRVVHDRRLHEGPDARTTAPAREREFVLLSIGRPIRERPAVSIRQFIRERARVRPAIDTRDDERHRLRRARIRRVRRLTALYGAEQMKLYPIVTPIALEVAGNLIPLVETQGGAMAPEFEKLVSMMRDGLLYELGVEFPGLRVRGNETDLPDGTYIVMLDEIPIVSGNVSLDKHLCNDTVDRLTLLNIKGEEAVNPANGAECAWIGPEAVDIARAAGLTTWDAAGYMILHLSSVLRKNAADFIGIGAAAERIRRYAGGGDDLYQAVCAARGGLPAFTTLLATLVEEEIPIHAVDVIARAFVDLRGDRPLHEIVEEVRCVDGVRDRLLKRFVRGERAFVYRLGEHFLNTVREGTHRGGEAAILALEPEPTQALLTEVRNEVASLPPTAPNPFVLVDDWRLRRPVRKLVELEFPHLWVVSQRELRDLADSEITTLALIDVDPSDVVRDAR